MSSYIYSRETNATLENDFDPATPDMDLTNEGEIHLPWNEFLEFTLTDVQPLLQAAGVPWASDNVFERISASGGAIGGVEFGVEPQTNSPADQPYTISVERLQVLIDGTDFGLINNENPIATPDTDTTITGGSIQINVVGNDTDIDSLVEPSTLQIVSPPTNGTATSNGDGSILYRHDGGASTEDSFTYRIFDEFGGVSNTATVEVSITPLFLSTCPTTIDLGDSGRGIAVRDRASGNGWLMWSNQTVFSRFSPEPFPGNAEHLIAVSFQNNQWLYDNNSVLTPFIPALDDCIIAELNFADDTANTLQGLSTTINGIDAGYLSGDLIITPNFWNGANNNGEFGITGSSLNTK